jgi:hypothetical protein
MASPRRMRRVSCIGISSQRTSSSPATGA